VAKNGHVLFKYGIFEPKPLNGKGLEKMSHIVQFAEKIESDTAWRL
jgi:hypothetical protein